MSGTPSPHSPMDEISFDQVEIGSQAAICGVCKAPLGDQYYEINGVVACPPCRTRAVRELQGGSGGARAFLALAAGGVAALLGALLYFGVAAITGYELGIVALVLGLMVGFAVRIGSGGRGGWFYQLLAVVLTYVSLACAYFGMVIREYAKDRSNAAVAVEDTEPRLSPAATAPATAPSQTDSAPTSTAVFDADAAEPGDDSAAAFATEATDTSEENIPVATILFQMAFLLAGMPVFVAMQSPISIVIIGLALYEAWKINKGRAVQINGPYSIGGPARARALVSYD